MTRQGQHKSPGRRPAEQTRNQKQNPPRKKDNGMISRHRYNQLNDEVKQLRREKFEREMADVDTALNEEFGVTSTLLKKHLAELPLDTSKEEYEKKRREEYEKLAKEEEFSLFFSESAGQQKQSQNVNKKSEKPAPTFAGMSKPPGNARETGGTVSVGAQLAEMKNRKYGLSTEKQE